MRPTAPTFEHHRDALGIGETRPRLSWKLSGAPDAWEQTRYEIEVDDHQKKPVRYARQSAEQVLVPWPAAPLTSRERRSVRVRVCGSASDSTAQWSEWSVSTLVEAGLLDPEDWSATMVTQDWDEDSATDCAPPLLRGVVHLSGAPVRARLYATAHGLYELEVNGRRVGDAALAPGWTSYDHRLRYQTYDVTDLLEGGENVVGALTADGWYRGRYGFNGGTRNLYGDRIGLLAQLEVTYGDGTTEVFGTDTSWRSATGPIGLASLYDGERYDGRAEQQGWSAPGFDDSAWRGVRPAHRDPATLVAPIGPPVRCTEEVQPVRVFTSPSGKTILDFGQNLVGRLRIRVHGERGHTVRLRHAEVLQDGELYTRPMRQAAATDEYTLGGGDTETWEPRFTIHGFRYAEVTGWPGEIAAGDIVARVYHTDMTRTGWFECSDEGLNRLHENVRWSMRGNFVDIPTDCPQRDERLGWTGDIQVFAPTASFLYDCAGMLSSWLADVAIEQEPDGTVPWYVPNIPGGKTWTPNRPGAVWGDVTVLTPHDLYTRFGDTGVLRAQYESGKKWIELVDRLAGPDHLWNEGFQLGDWLDPDAPPQDPADAKSDRYLVATAYFAHSTTRLAEIAALLGEKTDAQRFHRLAESTRTAFWDAYGRSDGRTTDDAAASYSLALVFDLVPAEHRAAAGARLAELVAESDYRISTGFAGTPVIADALTSTGHLDTAYRLVLQRECPSWLYAVEMGGTTIWERWDSMLPDGSVNPGEMTSFNHYALGAVADWLHRVVGGLHALDPGYRRIRIAPRPGGGLTSCTVRHETPYGPAEVSWTLRGDTLTARATIPTGTSAVVDLPGTTSFTVGSGTHEFVADLSPAAVG
ncbi:family 78 glycoside hydrolase catalytic domain [Rhodococcus koreensis]